MQSNIFFSAVIKRNQYLGTSWNLKTQLGTNRLRELSDFKASLNSSHVRSKT